MSASESQRDETIGNATPRREDARFLAGHGRYFDTVPMNGGLHAHFVRSPHAHAEIVSIDLSGLDGLPGVHGFSALELDELVDAHVVGKGIDGHRHMALRTLARGRVRFHGDPVVCVLAPDRYLAEDLAERVQVTYEPRSALVSTAEALAAAAEQLDPEVPDNLISEEWVECGDTESAFARAHRVVRRRLKQHRQTHLPMETRGCMASWDSGRGHLRLVIGTQIPHVLRSLAARRLRLREDQLTIDTPDVGGAFGQRLMLYREELVISALAIHLRTSIRWREDRMENLLSSAHGREDSVDIECAVTEKGDILGIRLDIVSDHGAYVFFPANYMPRMVMLVVPGAYRINCMKARLRAALTNKCPVAPMRAPMAIGSWVMESAVEAIASELGIDALDLRRRLLLNEGEMPWRTVAGQMLQDVNPMACLDRALIERPRTEVPMRQASAKARGRLFGRGWCVVVEPTTYGSAYYRSSGISGSGHEVALLRIAPSGSIQVFLGLMSSGQGYETTMAQIVAQELSVPVSAVSVRMGDTDASPYGMGSRGARGGTAGGNAVAKAARLARAKLLEIAAHHMGCSPEELELREGRAVRLGTTSVGEAEFELDIAALSAIAHLDPLSLPTGMEPGLDFTCSFDPPPMTFSNGVHVCDVEVDPDTGHVQVIGYLMVENAGRLVNPLIVEGQSHGAAAMGLSGALMEEVVYTATGQNQSATLADYHVASPVELPQVDSVHLCTESTTNPLGLKGMSEGGVLGASGALCLAVQDALKELGVVVSEQPLTPERIWLCIEATYSKRSASPRYEHPSGQGIHADHR